MLIHIVPVQGGWTSWVNAAPCSSLCADGTQTRVRNCTRPTPEYGGEDCIGDSKDTVQCGLDSCGNNIVCITIIRTYTPCTLIQYT